MALLLRGPVRVDYETQRALIVGAARQFPGVSVDVFVVTYKSTSFDFNSVPVPLVQVYLLEEPSERKILLALESNRRVSLETMLAPMRGGTRFNAFKQYWSSRIALTSVAASGDYDFIMHSRLDLHLVIPEPWLSSWFNSGFYATPHFKGGTHPHFHPFTNDQIGCADPETMLKAWSFNNFLELGDMLLDGTSPETVLDEMMAVAGVAPSQAFMAFGNHLIKGEKPIPSEQELLWHINPP